MLWEILRNVQMWTFTWPVLWTAYLVLACVFVLEREGSWRAGHMCWRWYHRPGEQTRQDLHCLYRTAAAKCSLESATKRECRSIRE